MITTFERNSTYIDQMQFLLSQWVEDYIKSVFDSDNSDLVFVDGEEGDFGQIKYFSNNGILIAVLDVYGGDLESMSITTEGREIIEKEFTKFFPTLGELLKKEF